MSDIIKDAKRLAELKVPPLRAEITVHEDEDPRYTDDCLVQIIEKGDEYSIWYEEEHGGYEHGKLHFAHVFAAAPELTQALAAERYEYCVQIWLGHKWLYLGRGYGMHQLEKYGYWCEKQEKAQAFLDGADTEHQLRIVRRRVSPVEEIE